MSVGKLIDPGTGDVFPLGFEPTTLGRHVDNSIVLADPQVSRHHAEIVMQAGRWVVRDLESANGTFVNDLRITTPHVLDSGDMVRVGQTSFEVYLAMPAAQHDTLVERLTPPPAAAVARPRSPWLALGLGLAAVVVVALVWALVVWPLLRGGDGGGQEGGVAQATSSFSTATAVAAGPEPSATDSSKPTETAIPTVPPPSPQPTIPQPTAALPQASDTPGLLPVIGYFRAAPVVIEKGQCTRLEWGQIDYADEVILSGVGAVGPAGKVDVCPEGTKTYLLQATGGGGSVEKSVQVEIRSPTGPSIEYFRVVPSIVSPGGCAQLEWGKVENSTSAVIDPDIGGVGTPGSLQVCPGATIEYRLTAQNPEGSSSAKVTLHVSTGAEARPVIAFFTANPASLRTGECTTLSWGKVDYATSVSIDNNIGGVATPGSYEVCLGTTTTFIMSAIGPGGTTESRVTVAVSPGKLVSRAEIVLESILFEPNPCYRGQKCKVRVKIRNDGRVAAGHFVVRWAPAGEEGIPVEWDVDSLGAGEERELTYPWIPSQANEKWWTLAIADLNDEVPEIGEGAANILEQYITVLSP